MLHIIPPRGDRNHSKKFESAITNARVRAPDDEWLLCENSSLEKELAQRKETFSIHYSTPDLLHAQFSQSLNMEPLLRPSDPSTKLTLFCSVMPCAERLNPKRSGNVKERLYFFPFPRNHNDGEGPAFFIKNSIDEPELFQSVREAFSILPAFFHRTEQIAETLKSIGQASSFEEWALEQIRQQKAWVYATWLPIWAGRPVELRPALFLDRDGVLNKDTNYVKNADTLQFLELPEEVLRFAREKAAFFGVISNQSGVGRGIIQESEMRAVNQKIIEHFQTKNIPLDFFFCARTHPEEGKDLYKCWSLMRKPYLGMFLRAASLYPILMSQSLMVGDKPTDNPHGLQVGFYKIG